MKIRPVFVALQFLAPNLCGFLLFTLFPVVFSLVMAFTDWDLTRHNDLSDQKILFVGLANFSEMLWGSEAPKFWYYFYNTLYLMLAIPVGIAGSLALALCLHEKIRFRTVFRTIYYLPTITAGVALLLLWSALLRPEGGLINQILGSMGLPQPGWLSSVTWAKPALMLIGIWTGIGGSNMILYLAGLSRIPVELFEAASMDGAGAWQRFRHIIWPQLAPTTFFISIMSIIGGLQGGFEQARILTLGGPAQSTTTLSYYIYQKGFEEFQLGYASAVSWILFLIVMALTLANWKFGNSSID
jgi:multiple sugar transport system permease protein